MKRSKLKEEKLSLDERMNQIVDIMLEQLYEDIKNDKKTVEYFRNKAKLTNIWK